MGEYAKRLHRKLASQASSLPTEEHERCPGQPVPSGVKDMATLIKEGLDPFHAAYVFMQNFTAYFGEFVSGLPEMESWAEAVQKAEDEYLPSGPPMSPLTTSYFWTWALYDLRIGKSTDTLAYCQIDCQRCDLDEPPINWMRRRNWNRPGWESTNTSAGKSLTSFCGN